MADALSVGEQSGRPARRLVSAGSQARYLLLLAGVALLYYGTAQVGYQFEFAGPVAAVVWLPAGVGIAVLHLGGMRFWPGIVAGDLLANDYSMLPWGSALGQTTGNVLEIVVTALLLQRLIGGCGLRLQTGGGVLRMVSALAAGTLISATVGSLSLLAGDVFATDALRTVWRTWWLGDFCGALIVVPLAIAWHPFPRTLPSRSRLLEAAAMVLAVALLSRIAFHASGPLVYLTFPGLLWAALRFGMRGATLAVTVTVGIAVWDTTHLLGPFAFESISRSTLNLQLYIAVAALSTLLLAAVVAERELFADRLAVSRGRMIEAGEAERLRIARNIHDGAQQRLTALAVHLRIGAEDSRGEPARLEPLVIAAQAELQLAIDELRELAHGAHPSQLTTLGFGGALDRLAERSTVPMTVLEVPTVRVDAAAEATAYYVVAEAVSNAQKHAHATALQVRARWVRGTLHIEVVDDGVGGAAEQPGSGLEGLHQRVAAMDGALDVASPPGVGTRIVASIPAIGPVRR
jgi:signal transduction histidine kinase